MSSPPETQDVGDSGPNDGQSVLVDGDGTNRGQFIHGSDDSTNRGQLVLVAAAAIAVALLLVLTASVQLGYTGGATGTPNAADADALDAAERAALEAATDRQAEHTWNDRQDVVDDVTEAVDKRADRIETAGVERGVVYRIERNQSAAADRVDRVCPQGDGRSFGSCRAIDGIVVQERVGETHVVAVAIDLRVVTADRTIDGTHVIDAETGTIVQQ